MTRKALILGGVLILLVVATLLVLQKPGESSTTGGTGEMLVSYDSAAVDKLVITQPSGTITLDRQSGKWMVAAVTPYPADDNLVAQALGKGKTIELKGIVSSNPQKQSLFQVDSSGTLVTVFEKGAERVKFHIGKPGPSFTETYVRRDGSDDVYLAEGSIGYFFTRQLREWRDKTIFKTDVSGIRQVTMIYGDTTTVLSLPDSLWRVDGMPAQETVVRSYLATIAHLQADDFVDSTMKTLPPLVYTIRVEGVDIRIFHDKTTNKYYVLSSAQSQLFEMQSWRAPQLLKRKMEFLPPA
jgi:hypothetical protein